MKYSVAVILIGAALLGGCSKEPKEPEDQIPGTNSWNERVKKEFNERTLEKAKEAVAKELIDPSSAQFRNVREVSSGIVCGEINGKNKFGGYVGFKEFYWSVGAPNNPVMVGESSTMCKY